jgi:hypothetical protein
LEDKVIDKIDNKDNTELQPNEDPVLPTQVYDNLGFRMQSVDIVLTKSDEIPSTCVTLSGCAHNDCSNPSGVDLLDDISLCDCTLLL